jgi:hypothetical protein
VGYGVDDADATTVYVEVAVVELVSYATLRRAATSPDGDERQVS